MPKTLSIKILKRYYYFMFLKEGNRNYLLKYNIVFQSKQMVPVWKYSNTIFWAIFLKDTVLLKKYFSFLFFFPFFKKKIRDFLDLKVSELGQYKVQMWEFFILSLNLVGYKLRFFTNKDIFPYKVDVALLNKYLG